MENVLIRRDLFFPLVSLSLFSLASQTMTSQACSVDDRYFSLTIEQRVSLAEHVFIGRVANIQNGRVIIDIEESLVGAKRSKLKVRQGHGTDCGHIFTEGKRIFFTGGATYDPTTEFDGTLPAELVPIVKKLRRGVPLDSVPANYFD